ncbi:MAG TPA: pitrilysin family protein [Tahibacter sp.]|uniref:M16 family metallopeptidase n=1 Tax=Tahibacter sp. TaxID=2056211 RepID=UPI002BCA8895|nr:pitrilysin family protein [Tahibacter sp.]HSX61532.1 pitrilysin family protein [Tahibacter sp.]
MRKTLILAAGLVLATGRTFAGAADAIDIPFEKFQLANGLTVIVHEDRKAPVVAVGVWYHVGSKDERPGKTGFAHLFEHLMFQGSENFRDEFFRPLEQVGATDRNGTTNADRTNYFETVPTTALDMTLWLESDRMGHLLGAIDQKQLDEQRGVVQNEKRQGDNEPYGLAYERILRASFPEGHPYRWETIGSMEDLNAASLDDVKQWFRDYYGAANTTVVLAGDIDVATAKQKMEKYFGAIGSGPPLARREAWVAPRAESTRDVAQDRVAQVRIYKNWNVPQRHTADLTRLQLAAAILGGGKTSRLYERLIYREQLADSVSVSIEAMELASLFSVEVDVKKGVDPVRVEQVVAEEWQRFLDKGPTEDELQRVKTSTLAGLVRAIEKVGGSGKARTLAEGQVFAGDPGAYRKALARMDAATVADVQAAAKQWVSRGDYTLVIEPFPDYSTTSDIVDRSKGLPAVDSFPDLTFPAIERGRLRNGIEVVLARRSSIPIVQLSLQFGGGYASDQGRKLGTASFAMAMLDEGTRSLDALQIAKRQEELGVGISAGADLDVNGVTMNALKSQLKPSLALFADIVRNPAYAQADMERVRGLWLSGIAQERTQPVSIALRLLPPLIYGDGHPYAIPFTGSGTVASITSLTPQDLADYHRDFIRPDNARIMVAGDTTLAEITRELDAVFGDWKAPAAGLKKPVVVDVAQPSAPRVFLMNRPGAQQSLILAGETAPSSRAKNYLEIGTMNTILGGSFMSRLNMNLREDKHWAYGVRSLLPGAEGPGMFLLYAPVQTDKTAESVAELLKEVRDISGKRPITGEEIDRARNNDVRELPGRFETTGAVLAAVIDIVRNDRPDDYVQTFKQRIENQKPADIQAAATEVVRPDALTWLIVGDLAKIEAGVRALNLGEVKVVDADGKVVR